MKRFFVTILSILYLASAMGTTLDVHYCMGKSVGANFVHKDDDKCRKCGMHKSKTKGCCEDKQETFKTSEHQIESPQFDFTHAAIALPPATVAICYSTKPVCNYSITQPVLVNAPPNTWRTKPIYLSIRNLRI